MLTITKKICFLCLCVLLVHCSGSKDTAKPDPSENRDNYHIIRVLTYNILHGENAKGEIDMDLYADIIKEQKPDLVALQEVDKFVNRSGKIDIIAELSERTGLEGRFTSYRPYGGGEFGDGILSKFPILDYQRVAAYQSATGVERAYTFAKVQIADDGTAIYFNCSHLSPYVEGADERVEQAKELVNYYQNTLNKTPLLICGDLNAEPNSDPLKILLQHFSPSDKYLQGTFSARAAKAAKKIDFILHPTNDNWKVFEVKRICRGDASDHCALFAEIGFKKQK